MSDTPLSSGGIRVLINDGIEANTLFYVANQAIAGDHVVLQLSIDNRTLVKWAGKKGNRIELLNEAIPGGSGKIKSDSNRVHERLIYQSWKAAQTLRKLNRQGTKTKH